MKPELINLLHRLKSHPEMEGFQNLIIYPNGTSSAIYRFGSKPFRSLDALEQFAYAEERGSATRSNPDQSHPSDPS